MRTIKPCEICRFSVILYITHGKLTAQSGVGTEKRQTSQGYIIRILQHFATKLRNTANFVMLFQAVMKFLSRSKF
jgi:hypothetical protein